MEFATVDVTLEEYVCQHFWERVIQTNQHGRFFYFNLNTNCSQWIYGINIIKFITIICKKCFLIKTIVFEKCDKFGRFFNPLLNFNLNKTSDKK